MVLQLVSQSGWGLTRIISATLRSRRSSPFCSWICRSTIGIGRTMRGPSLAIPQCSSHRSRPRCEHGRAFSPCRNWLLGRVSGRAGFGHRWTRLGLAYETVFQFATLFHHSNVRFPIRIERWLNFILVTPRMHGIHHSEEFDETNSNWSSVFSWWDRLHRTLRLNVSQSIIDIGIAGYSLPHDNTVRATLAMPFGTAGLLARCRRQGSGAPK